MELIQQLGKYVEMIPLNTTEIVALAILLYGAVMGLKNGFLKELASMTGFFIGLYLAWKYYEQIGGGAIAFIGIWVVTPIALGFSGHQTAGLDSGGGADEPSARVHPRSHQMGGAYRLRGGDDGAGGIPGQVRRQGIRAGCKLY